MNLAIDELKVKAKKLLKLHRSSAEQNTQLRLLDCQLQIAKSLGFDNYNHARVVLTGEANLTQQPDFGTLWYDPGCVTFTNQWFSHYEQALAVKNLNQLCLLPYKRQFLLVDDDFLGFLGLGTHGIQLVGELNRDLVAGYASRAWHELLQIRIRQSVQLQQQLLSLQK